MNFKEGFTQIPNETLEVFIKGLLSETEMRIALYVIRQSSGFHRDWTSESTVQKMADDIGMRRAFCSTTINRMIKQNKIKRENGKFKFNENYKSWMVSSNPNAQIVSSNPNGDRPVIRTVVSSNRNGEDTNSTEQESAPTTPKYILNKYLNIKERNIKERKITFNAKTLKFENIPKEKEDKWIEAYPNCNIDLELKKMEAWLAANPEKRKKKYEKFIVNWLARAKGDKANERYIGITGNKEFTGANNANAGEW